MLVVAVGAHAGTRYWDGGTTNIPCNGNSTSFGGDGTWNTSIKNWDNGAVPHTNWVNANNDTAVFGGTGGIVTNQGVTVGGLTFTTANYVIMNSNVTFGVAGTISNSVDATIASGLAGTVAVTKSGAGTLTLSGSNTYSGGTVVATGTLALVGLASQPASSTLAISNGATVRLSAAVDTTWPATTVMGAGTLVADTAGGLGYTLSGYNMGGFTGVLDVLASGYGKVGLYPPCTFNSAATLKIENGATAYYGWYGFTNSCNVELNGVGNSEGLGALRLEGNALQNGPVLLKANSEIGGASGSGYIGGVISDGGAGYGIIIDGSATIVLQATNTYSGATVVGSGALQCNNPNALGNGGALSIANGAVVNLNYSGTHTISALTLSGVVMPAGVYGSTNSPAIFQDPHFSGTGTVTIASATNNTSLRWWDGGATNITGTGDGASSGRSGTWNTTIRNWDAGAVPHTNWFNANNDTAVFGGTAGVVTNQGVTVGGLVFLTANYLLTNGVVTFGVAGTIWNAVDATIASVLAGTVTLTKNGIGTLTLAATNTYCGPTTVNAGMLIVPASGRLGTNDLTIATGATVEVKKSGAISSNATVYLNGVLNLAAGVTNTVRRLYINGVCQQAGLWNAARDATHFSGSGCLNVIEFPFGKMIPLRSPTYRGYDFCASLSGGAISGSVPYEILYDTGSWDTCIPYGSLNKSNITVLSVNVTDCWGYVSDMVQGQLSLTSADGTTNYTIDNFVFYARRNADGSEAPDDRGQSGGNSIMGAFPSIWPSTGRPSLPFLLAQKYSLSNAVGLGIVSDPLQDFHKDWSHAKSYLQLGSDPQITSNLNWRSDLPLSTVPILYTNYCPYRVPGFGVTFSFTSNNVPDIVVTGLNATVDSGASDLVLRIATNDPQRNTTYRPFFSTNGPGWWPGTAYETNALTLIAGQNVGIEFTSDTGKAIYYHFLNTDTYSSPPGNVTVGDWASSVPWPVTTDTPRDRINLGNTIYFFCPVYFWDVSNNRVGVSDFVDNTKPWGVSLDNSPATVVTTNSARLNAALSCSGTNFDVIACWNTVNGGTSATQWTNSIYVGSWTNVLSTNISCTVSALKTNTTYYFRFLATNAATIMWAPSVLNFTTLPLPPVITGQPASTTNMVGSTATFTVAATGATSYQWYKGGVPLSDGGSISGSGTPTLTLNSVGMSDAGNYSVVVGNANTNVTSVSASLTVIPLATLTWDANGTGAGLSDGAGSWINSSNTWWNGATNVNWTDYNYARIGSGGTGGVITLGTGIAAALVTFTNFGGTYTLTNGTLSVVSNLTVVASAGNVSIYSPISGAGSVTMSSTNTLTLSGSNTYTGSTIVNAGTLQASGNSAVAGRIAVAGGAILVLAGTSGNAWPVGTLTGAGTVNMLLGGYGIGINYDMSAFTGLLDLTNGLVVVTPYSSPSFVSPANGTINVRQNTTLYLGWEGYHLNTTVQLNGGNDNGEGYGQLRGDTATLNGAVILKANSTMGSVGAGNTFVINAGISDGGAGCGLTKVSGGTIVLTATNTYTGPTVVNAGTLQCNCPDALGSGGALNIANGAVLNLNYPGTHVVAALTLGGTNKPFGVYGSTNSPAANQDPHFSGTGTVTVASFILNQPVSGIATNKARLNALLACSGTNFVVRAYWNTISGGTNATQWTNSAYAGSWTNAVTTNLSYTVTNLIPNTTYYFTFRATNAVQNLWATNVLSFYIEVPSWDSVGDGIPDLWRKQYFGGAGTTTNSQSCSTSDYDGDGANTYQEFLAGTDPLVASSVLRIGAAVFSNGTFCGSFGSVIGKVYAVETNANLTVTNGWNALISTNGTGGMIIMVDPWAGSFTNRFYRVRILP